MKNLLIIFRLICLFCFLIIFLNCKNTTNEAKLIIEKYINAYSNGDVETLKHIFSNKLNENYKKYILFFKSQDFETIRKELINYRIIFSKIIKKENSILVNYNLILNDKRIISDSITLINENGKLKLNETGMFVFR